MNRFVAIASLLVAAIEVPQLRAQPLGSYDVGFGNPETPGLLSREYSTQIFIPMSTRLAHDAATGRSYFFSRRRTEPRPEVIVAIDANGQPAEGDGYDDLGAFDIDDGQPEGTTALALTVPTDSTWCGCLATLAPARLK